MNLIRGYKSSGQQVLSERNTKIHGFWGINKIPKLPTVFSIINILL